jgi:hypothetical protein
MRRTHFIPMFVGHAITLARLLATASAFSSDFASRKPATQRSIARQEHFFRQPQAFGNVTLDATGRRGRGSE